ncbi:hypothetical protein BJ875DRAFT_389475 [Amylocarpus encephaloides]|uniref:Uncharacterized protein n=1 Tax=Amylocarpus encephaloides TaxID=45428 RepID=A0A9P7Y750_9HELO|nr:hypothetical protein BJ875DRAFT_389475 [Amylocarpus encephaloides]
MPPPNSPVSSFDPAHYDSTLDVAIYCPTDTRDPHHWAINIITPGRCSSTHQVYEYVGGRGYYVAPPRFNIRPFMDRLHRVSIIVGRIRWFQLNRVRHMIQGWRVNNRSTTWNCQSWVMEIIIELRRRGWLALRRRALSRLIREREYWR